jgi:hypothetical protein
LELQRRQSILLLMTYADPLFTAYRRRRGLPEAPRSVACPLCGDRGQALVEFALILPIFVLLLLGVVDFGRAFNYKNDMTSLANQAARFAEVNQCTPCGAGSIETYIRSTADSGELTSGSGTFGIVPPGITVATCFPAGANQGKAGTSLVTTVSGNYKWIPFLNLAPVRITSSVTVRIATSWATPASGNAYMQGGLVTC